MHLLQQTICQVTTSPSAKIQRCCRELEQGRYHSVNLYLTLAINMHCSHYLWVNTRAEHAFFVEHDFEVEHHRFRAHPSAEEPTPTSQWLDGDVPRYWKYQVLPCSLSGIHPYEKSEPTDISPNCHHTAAEP